MDRIIAAKVFVTITERGSMIVAAEALDMSRAMVTRYLAEMEAWAGARLLHRSTRRLSLTDAGDVTLARCRSLLELAGGMEWRPTTSTRRKVCCAPLARPRWPRPNWPARSAAF